MKSGLQWVFGWTQWLVAQLRELAPYFVVELVLPGGTLVALALWLYRRRNAVAEGVSR